MRLQIDKKLVENKFLNSIETYNENAIIQKKMAEKLISNLAIKSGKFYDKILEIGSGTGLLTKEIIQHLEFTILRTNDFSADYEGIIKKIIAEHKFNYKFIKGDAEYVLNFPENNNLIISNATYQWFEDVVSFIKKMSNNLNNDGIFAFTTFGKNNFFELNLTEQNSLEYISIEKVIEQVSDLFDVVYFMEETEKLYFSSPIEVLQHIKNTGVNGINRSFKFNLKQFVENYNAKFTTKNGVSLTYNPIYLILKKKANL
jgi:malonyl-ACP O-methyltransferase BioC